MRAHLVVGAFGSLAAHRADAQVLQEPLDSGSSAVGHCGGKFASGLPSLMCPWCASNTFDCQPTPLGLDEKVNLSLNNWSKTHCLFCALFTSADSTNQIVRSPFVDAHDLND